MGLGTDFALLHAAERLLATHKGAVAELEPLVQLARKFFDDGDGNISRSDFFNAIRAELAILEGQHQTIKDAIDDVRSMLPDAEE